MLVRKMQRTADREIRALTRRWTDKIQRVQEAMTDEIENVKDAHGLPPDLVLDTNQGIFVFAYRAEDAEKLVDVPAVPSLEDVSLGDEDPGISDDLTDGDK